MRFAFLSDHKALFPIQVLCKGLKVSRSGYYAWSRRRDEKGTELRGKDSRCLLSA